MVQSVNTVSMFPEVSGAKTVSKTADSKFESFLENDLTEPVTNSSSVSDKAEHKQVANNQNDDQEITNVSESDDKVTVSQTAQKSEEETGEITEVKASESVPETESADADYVENTEPMIESEDFELIGLIRQKDESELPDEILSEILSVLNEITSVFQNMFHCTEEQFMDAAQSVQFEITDFFDSDKIRELFLQIQNAEAPELLTDEALCDEFLNLQTQVNAIMQESKLAELLPETEVLNDVIEISDYKEQIINFVFEKSNEVDNAMIKQPSGNEVVLQPVDMQKPVVEKVLKQESENEIPSNNDFVVASDESIVMKTDTSALQNNMTEADEKTPFEAEQMETNDSLPETEVTTDRVNVFLNRLVNVAKNQLSETASVGNQAVELYDIAMQVIEQVRLQVSPDTSKMEIQLNPEHLGKVEVELTSKNGEVSAKLSVQNDQVKEAVESQMQMLRETLEVQGLKVENIEVTVAEFGFRFQDEAGNNQSQQQQQQRKNFVSFDDADAEDTSLHDVAEVMKELNGNSVDYVA